MHVYAMFTSNDSYQSGESVKTVVETNSIVCMASLKCKDKTKVLCDHISEKWVGLIGSDWINE